MFAQQLTAEVWAEVQLQNPLVAKAMRKDPQYKPYILKFDEDATAIAAAKKDARVAEVKANGAVVLGQHYSYEELLCLATITVKSFYELPEGSIVHRLREDVKAALAGVVSLEANSLKETIAGHFGE